MPSAAPCARFISVASLSVSAATFAALSCFAHGPASTSLCWRSLVLPDIQSGSQRPRTSSFASPEPAIPFERQNLPSARHPLTRCLFESFHRHLVPHPATRSNPRQEESPKFFRKLNSSCRLFSLIASQRHFHDVFVKISDASVARSRIAAPAKSHPSTTARTTSAHPHRTSPGASRSPQRIHAIESSRVLDPAHASIRQLHMNPPHVVQLH